jgi:hypothetical protein
MRNARHILPLLLLATGCAVRQPAAWRLSGQVLVPPGVTNVAASRAMVTVPRAAVCPGNDAIGVERRKLVVDRTALEKEPRGWLADWSARCGMSPERILDSLPLDSLNRIRLIRDSDVRAGFLDLTAAMRLQVITPTNVEKPLDIVNVSGTDKSLNVDVTGSERAIVGREVSWYGFEPRPGGGARIVRVSPGTQDYYAAFSLRAAYFRFFYMADQMSVVAGVPSFDKLPRDLEGCGKPGGVECVSVPPKVGVNVFTRVMVNGEAVVVASPTVRAVIQTAKRRPEDVLPTLAITKLYQGKQTPLKFDRSKPDILNLWLVGNEEIRW